MPPRFRLKTKLVLAISGMVFALVATLSSIYVSQMLRHRVAEAYESADFVVHEAYEGVNQALQLDLSDLDDPQELQAAIEDSIQTDPGLNTLLQSIVGYSPIIYDVAIADTRGRALQHTNSGLLGKQVEDRPNFGVVRDGGFRQQLRVVYGKPKVYEIRLPLVRQGRPFGDIRVGVSTVFLKSELQPQLNRAVMFSALAILVSLALAAGLSNIALRPLEAIGRRLDRLSAGEIELPEKETVRSDEFGVVNTKISRLGRQIKDVKEVFSALKENLDQIMANLQDGLMLCTRDWRVVLVSASAERFVGLRRGEMLGRNIEEIFSNGSRLGHLILDAFHLHHPLAQREIETAAGQRVQVSLDFIEEHGERIGALITMRDAETVRSLEDEIELSRRLAAIGRLTSGVAHEVKNPINAIVVHLEVLREKLQATDPDTRRHMDVIGNEIQRLDRVVQTLVDFSRPVELRLGETDLRRVVEDVVVLASPEAERHGVTVARQIAPDALPVIVDADLAKQALLNVVINGVQAMPDGGLLTVVVGRQNDDVLVEVRDQGSGIPAEIRDKVFNLYFTTKQAGSGIGLAMAYRVMQLHNGSVDFESQPGQGTIFRLRFPALEARRDAMQEAAAKG